MSGGKNFSAAHKEEEAGSGGFAVYPTDTGTYTYF
jgi:hypothetical protein